MHACLIYVLQLLDPSTDITAAFKSLQDQQRQAALTTSTEASTSGGSSSHPSAAFNPAKYQSATLEARRFAANRPSSSSSVLTAGERPSGDGASSLGSPTATAAATAAAGADYSSLVAAGAEQQEEVPLALLCALTQRLLHDPVVAADGFTYERDAWVGWLEQGNKVSALVHCVVVVEQRLCAWQHTSPHADGSAVKSGWCAQHILCATQCQGVCACSTVLRSAA